MHSVSDLTTFSRSTSGDIPPKLVGASTTVVGNKVYLYGGRLVTERRMVTDMWVFDLNALVWKKIDQSSDDDLPASRYFHSADSWDHYLVVFGGMGINPEAEDASDELLVLNDVRFFDLSSFRWMPASWSSTDLVHPPLAPKPRYAHLSSVSGNRLFVIGGQDLHNVWLDDVYVYDLARRGWVSSRDYPRHCGTYRSVAVAGNLRVRLPQHEAKDERPTPKPVFQERDPSASSSNPPLTDADSLIHLPYSAPPSDDFPTNIYLYSNYNFTDVKRELEVFTPRPGENFDISDQSSAMVGTSFPPGLRFPSGAILGHHLIIAGTYLAHSFQSSSVWALNLHDMTWTRIDPGSTLSSGSWFRTALWADSNKFVIFGNRSGNLVDDYNRRLLSWDDVAIIDLEAFGIYQPPRLALDIRMQEIGLAALEEGVLADFEVVCDDDRRIRCSRRLLEERWPWFREQRKLFVHRASRAAATDGNSTDAAQSPPVPDIPGFEPRPDPRLTPRYLTLSEPYPITLALLQYLYSLALLTPLQHAPPVLSALLVLSTNYNIPHLQALVRHAMHRALSNSTSVGVYEVATLCSCRSLQIRALKTVMLYNQKRPAARSRQDKDGSGRPAEPNGGGRDTNGSSGGGGGAGGGGGGGDTSAAARPRGMSDAQMLSRQGGMPAGRTVSSGVALETEELEPLIEHDSALDADPRFDLALAPTPRPIPLRTMSSPPTSPPPPLPPKPFLGRKLRHDYGHDRRSSILSMVSIDTHLDLTSFGDLLFPIIDAPGAEPEAAARERDSLPIDEAVERTYRTTSVSSTSTSSSSAASVRTTGTSTVPRLAVEGRSYAPSVSSSRSGSGSSSEQEPTTPSPLERILAAEDSELSFLEPSPFPSLSSRRRDSASSTPTLASYGRDSTSSLVYRRDSGASSTYIRDSDTPSLTSSASRSSFSSMGPFSLASPPTSPSINLAPAEHHHHPDHYLSTIDEYDGLSGHHRRPRHHHHHHHHHQHPYAIESAFESDDEDGGPGAGSQQKGDAVMPKKMPPTRRGSDGLPITFADPTSAAAAAAANAPPRQLKQRMPNIEALRLQTASPAETIQELMSPTLPAVAPTAMMQQQQQSLNAIHQGQSPSPVPSSGSGGAGGSRLARLLSPNKSSSGLSSADSRAREKERDKVRAEQVRQLKAEAKRLRKEEDRLRKERLMIEFRAKAESDKRKGDARSIYSNKSEDAKARKTGWEEQGAMFDGLGAML